MPSPSPDTEAQSPRPRRRVLPPWAPRAAFECLLIVFSVVLALSLNDWAADRREAERAAQVRTALIAEIAANRDVLAGEQHLPHHLNLRQVFGQAGGRPDAPGDREAAMQAVNALFSTGLRPVRLRDAVWRSAGSGDLIARLPSQDVFLLAEIYRSQEDLETLNRTGYQTTVDLIDLLEPATPHQSRLMRMTLYLEDMTTHEQSLLALYDRALAQMGGEAQERDSEAR